MGATTEQKYRARSQTKKTVYLTSSSRQSSADSCLCNDICLHRRLGRQQNDSLRLAFIKTKSDRSQISQCTVIDRRNFLHYMAQKSKWLKLVFFVFAIHSLPI